MNKYLPLTLYPSSATSLAISFLSQSHWCLKVFGQNTEDIVYLQALSPALPALPWCPKATMLMLFRRPGGPERMRASHHQRQLMLPKLWSEEQTHPYTQSFV